MNISHPCWKLNIGKNGFLGITFDKLFFDKTSTLCVFWFHKKVVKEKIIIFNSLQENDKKLTVNILPFIRN